MSWNEIQNSGMCIDSDEWNTMASYIRQSHYSGANAWNSHNYHNSGLVWDDSLKKFKAMKSGGGVTSDVAWSGAYQFYSVSGIVKKLVAFSANKTLYKPSSGIWQFASSQLLSGQLLNLHSARDILNWNSSAWKNSGLMWDSTLKKWKPHKSGASTGGPGATAFIDLTDVPQSYSGKIGKIPMVNATGDGLIFVDIVCVNGTSKMVYSESPEDPQIVFTNNGVVFG